MIQGEFESKINACRCTTSNPGKKYTIDEAIDEKKRYKTKQNSKKVELKVSRKNEIHLMYERYETSRFSH